MRLTKLNLLIAAGLVLLLSTPTQSQFVVTLGGTHSDHADELIETSDGGFVVVGNTYGFSAGYYDLLFSKFDCFGNHLWTKTMHESEPDAAISVVETSDGGFVVTGYSFSFGAGARDVLLAKFSSSGILLWTKTLGGGGYWELGVSVIETSDGGLVVTGETNSYGAGYRDLLLAKFDSSGNYLWTKTLGGTGRETGNCVAETHDGGLAVTGLTHSYGAGSGDLLLAKFSVSGDTLWTRTLGGEGFEHGHSVVQTSDSGLAVVGITFSFGTGDTCLLLTKFDASGGHLWTRTLGGMSYLYEAGPASISEASDGGLIVAGTTDRFGAGNGEVLLAKFNSSGDFLWARVLGGTSHDECRSLIEASDGGLVVTGFTDSFGAGSYDILLARFDASGNTCLGEFVTPTILSVSPTITSPTPTITSPSPIITSASPTITSPTPTVTVVCMEGPGSVSGTVSDSLGGVLGVAVDLFDSTGSLAEFTYTDVSGFFEFDSVDAGDYTISIVTPLGYVADFESRPITVTMNGDSVVNFTLHALEIVPSQRSMGYWKHQVNVHLSGRGHAQESLGHMSNYMSLIGEHFNNNLANPIAIFEVPQPATQTDSLEALQELLTVKGNAGMNAKARQQLTALMLNVVSLKLHQTTPISEDNATVSQAITYCNQLITDSDPTNDEIAKDVADQINNGILVAYGVIPLTTPNIAYKGTEDQIPQTSNLPEEFSLEQNYPNPFNPICEIAYALPTDCQVTLSIYNILGQKVRVLVDEYQTAGHKSVKWNGKDDQGKEVTSGVYFYRIQAGDFVQSKKMILMK